MNTTIGIGRKNEKWNPFLEGHFEKPLHWKKPRRVFVNSMSDLFHENVPDEFIDKVFAVMALCPQHTFQVLTKRPERMREYLTNCEINGRKVHRFVRVMTELDILMEDKAEFEWEKYGYAQAAEVLVLNNILPNVHLGVPVEDQQTANERIPPLLDTPAAVWWVSAEPLLGAIDFSDLDATCIGHDFVDVLLGEATTDTDPEEWEYSEDGDGYEEDSLTEEEAVARIDWVVVGGESGRDARPMHPDWVRSIRDQCQAAGVAFNFKQWGEWCPLPLHDARLTDRVFSKAPAFDGLLWRVGKKNAGRLLDGVLWDEYPGEVAS